MKENKTFFLEIIKKENDYLSKPKKTLMAGTWRILGDTLKLYQVGEKDNPLIFFVKEEKLLFQNNNMMLSNSKIVLPYKDLLYLDYLLLSKDPK
ncbi:MAG: hypothetical protein IPP99_04110 [Chitinophagaceae bacterium]|nr:hypothetical protein [Chitinophagaceae bacterium]